MPGVQVEQENYAIGISIFFDGTFPGKGLIFFTVQLEQQMKFVNFLRQY